MDGGNFEQMKRTSKIEVSLDRRPSVRYTSDIHTLFICFMERGARMMKIVFGRLLRSNFRCGRMLYSRTHRCAGVFVAPSRGKSAVLT